MIHNMYNNILHSKHLILNTPQFVYMCDCAALDEILSLNTTALRHIVLVCVTSPE